MKNKLFLAVVVIGLLVAVGVFFLPPKVSVVKVQQQNLQQKLVFLGKVASREQIDLAASQVAQVANILVAEGDIVEAGQVVLELDTSEAKAKLAQAQANLQQLQLQQRQLQHSELPTAQNNLAKLANDYQLAQQEVLKTKTLVAKGFYAPAKLQLAENQLAQATAELANAKLRVQDLSAQGLDNQLNQAKLAQTQAEIAQAQANLTKLVLRAPTKAVVGKISTTVGNTASIGEVLVQLMALGDNYIQASLDEKNLPYLVIGQPAKIQADAFKGQYFAARLNYVAPVIDPLRGTVEVKLWLLKPPKFLKPDMTVTVDLTAAEKPQALVVAREYLNDLYLTPWLAVIKHGRVSRQPVELGLITNKLVELRAGVKEGDLVALAEDVAGLTKVRVAIKEVD